MDEPLDPMDRNPMDFVDLVEVYALASQIGAERVVVMLQDAGIEAEMRESSVAGFPATGTASFLVVVPGNEGQRAADIIRQAVDDGVLPGGGTFLFRTSAP